MGSGTVRAFPLERRHALVATVARALADCQGEQANQYWRETAKRHLAQLQALGIPRATAEREVRRLLYAVLAHLNQPGQVATL